MISFKHLSSCFCVFRLFVFYLHIGEIIVSINTNHKKWCHFFLRVGFLPQFTLSSLLGNDYAFEHSEKSGFAFLKVVHHTLVKAHQAKLFSHKIFSLNSILPIVRLMVLF